MVAIPVGVDGYTLWIYQERKSMFGKWTRIERQQTPVPLNEYWYCNLDYANLRLEVRPIGDNMASATLRDVAAMQAGNPESQIIATTELEKSESMGKTLLHVQQWAFSHITRIFGERLAEAALKVEMYD